MVTISQNKNMNNRLMTIAAAVLITGVAYEISASTTDMTRSGALNQAQARLQGFTAESAYNKLKPLLIAGGVKVIEAFHQGLRTFAPNDPNQAREMREALNLMVYSSLRHKIGGLITSGALFAQENVGDRINLSAFIFEKLFQQGINLIGGSFVNSFGTAKGIAEDLIKSLATTNTNPIPAEHNGFDQLQKNLDKQIVKLISMGVGSTIDQGIAVVSSDMENGIGGAIQDFMAALATKIEENLINDAITQARADLRIAEAKVLEVDISSLESQSASVKEIIASNPITIAREAVALSGGGYFLSNPEQLALKREMANLANATALKLAQNQEKEIAEKLREAQKILDNHDEKRNTLQELEVYRGPLNTMQRTLQPENQAQRGFLEQAEKYRAEYNEDSLAWSSPTMIGSVLNNAVLGVFKKDLYVLVNEIINETKIACPSACRVAFDGIISVVSNHNRVALTGARSILSGFSAFYNGEGFSASADNAKKTAIDGFKTEVINKVLNPAKQEFESSAPITLSTLETAGHIQQAGKAGLQAQKVWDRRAGVLAAATDMAHKGGLVSGVAVAGVKAFAATAPLAAGAYSGYSANPSGAKSIVKAIGDQSDAAGAAVGAVGGAIAGSVIKNLCIINPLVHYVLWPVASAIGSADPIVSRAVGIVAVAGISYYLCREDAIPQDLRNGARYLDEKAFNIPSAALSGAKIIIKGAVATIALASQGVTAAAAGLGAKVGAGIQGNICPRRNPSARSANQIEPAGQLPAQPLVPAQVRYRSAAAASANEGG